MHFADRLNEAMRAVGNPVVVGIDPRLGNLPAGWLERFPKSRAGRAEAVGAFANQVVDAVRGLVPAVKFQAAFFEQLGPEGMTALESAARHARASGLIVILDGKRNDIGSTAEAYAQAYLETESESASESAGAAETSVWCADALTVNPYLGTDGIAPFVNAASRGDRGIFVLVRTSNPSAREFQDLVADGRPVYRHVAERLAGWASPQRGASGYSLVGAVVGATYPDELAELRAALPGVVFLVPGYGAQGGTAASIAPAFDAEGLGAIVNNSRGIAFAYERPALRERFGSNWQGAIEAAVREMAADLAAHTPAGRLKTR